MTVKADEIKDELVPKRQAKNAKTWRLGDRGLAGARGVGRTAEPPASRNLDASLQLGDPVAFRQVVFRELTCRLPGTTAIPVRLSQ